MDVERVELGPARLVGVQETVPMDHLTEFFDRAFGAAAGGLAAQGAPPTGPAVALYRGDVTEVVDLTAGFVVPLDAPAPGDGLVDVRLPEGAAVVTVHVGPYDTLEQTYAELGRWMAERGLAARDVMWEEYLDGPAGEPDPARWRTRVVTPIS
ncbi:AraC family transcriptional regulator [Actinotalea ferrariae CF5-4]|uniref:AraC family transcriptional regulator n=1 Tax=Actinotalea ferrariae CF5-4 TaxID=948458 RepID=A0A021VRG5_9CELL|nr:GyrI-like domain-containing protein [Actinotalea ferrariae]EYR63713.1 AraC family transcriptional regulator [Actinotalea ferrariae CF5-4]